MAAESTRPERVWDRLRRNRERNTELFTDAGVRPERAGAVVCPQCGAEESALFWSTVRRRGTVVHLLCPVCETARVRYNLKRNQVMDPLFNRHSVGGGMTAVFVLAAAGALFYFRDTPPVRAVVEDALVARASAEKTLYRLTDGRFGDRYSIPAAAPARASAVGSGGSPVRTGASRSSATGASGRGAPFAGAAGSRIDAAPRVDAAAEARSGVDAYVLPGDRRAAVAAFTAEVAARYGADEAAALREVRYDAATRETRVVIDTTSGAWQRWLAAQPGGQRIGR